MPTQSEIHVIIPINIFQQPEFTKLHELTKAGRYTTLLAFWVKLLFKAAELQHDGLLFVEPDKPLSIRAIARWNDFQHDERVPPLLQLLCTCKLIAPAANGQYRICHWERFFVAKDTAHGRPSRFYDPQKPPTAQPAPQPPVPLPANVTPLALQKYTPEQRAKLAASSHRILAYLQQQSGKAFTDTVATQVLLAALFEQKVTVKQIKRVIDWKCHDWYGGDYWKFVRPQTLFGPKFKQYLLEAPPPPHVQPAARLTKQQYLRDLYQLSCGDVNMVLLRAADEAVTVTKAEVEAIGHELGY
ncbi:conserved phage C-terminal domain-containing protein [Loigolactobacillus jiayinensis]|uniref:Conserved phage C-terminal domain-containing protein n=1 Tax=Loigolactobacillus jiayinensis TaxID=2486016 RepID=A0ABW1RC84_9LACO|nr:conserved phage C-terminal domain-containing protein [Loigolactobacillus jiayinensis]